ncbi:MAG: SulP family inorganic anion transporter [Rikenellaceae bacterium]
MLNDFTPKIFTSIKTLNKDQLFRDIMSGISVGIVALPLAVAFGISSGVTPEQGLISAIIGGLIVSLLGGSSTQIAGPSGTFLIISYSLVTQYGVQGLLLATAMAGVILMLMGFLRLGTIIKFIPYPIIVGFTSGIAILIVTSQVRDFFGVDNSIYLPSDFIGKWGALFQNISSVSIASICVAILTALIMTQSKRLTTKIPGSLIAIIAISLLVYIFDEVLSLVDVQTIGSLYSIKSAIPAPQAIDFSLESIQLLLPSAFTIALLSAIEALLSAIVADGITGDSTNSNMELIAQGAANFTVPFFGGIPLSGVIARTMTNVANGGRTPLAGVIHSLLLLGVLLFLMPLVKFVPMAALSGVLLVVSYNMSEWRTFVGMVRTKTSGSLVLIITFILTIVVDLSVAIEMGLILAALLFMKRISESSSISLLDKSVTTSSGEELNLSDEIGVYEIDGPFFFGVANKFEEVMKSSQNSHHKVRIIRMRRVPFIDTTGLHNLEMLIRRSVKSGIHIVLSGINEDVRKSLANSEFINSTLGEDDICDNITIAVERAKNIAAEC